MLLLLLLAISLSPHSVKSEHINDLTPTPYPEPSDGCGGNQRNGRADVIFVVDSSGSIGQDNWPRVLGFLKDFAEHFDIGPDGIQMGVVTFGSSGRVEFHLNDYQTSQDVVAAIDRIGFRDQRTNTASGINTMTNEMFTPAHGDRPDAVNIGVVFTDGRSSPEDRNQTIPSANRARERHISLFAIGVGDEIDHEELEAIAGGDERAHVFESFETLSCNVPFDVVLGIANSGLQEEDVCQVADIVFVVDSSGSVKQHWTEVLEFLVQVVERYSIGPLQVQVGVVIFGNKAHIQFHLNEYSDKEELIAHIRSIRNRDEATNTADGLHKMCYEMFTAANGNRPGARNIGIVMTDGESTHPDTTIAAADEARSVKEISIFAIGVGGKLNMTELYGIADNREQVILGEFDNLDMVDKQISSTVCQRLASCYEENDVTLLLDFSSHGSHTELRTLVGLARNLTRRINVSPGRTKLALVTYSSVAQVHLGLETYSTLLAVDGSLSELLERRPRGRANLARGLALVRERVYRRDGGVRDHKRPVVVLITHGYVSDPAAALEEAKMMKLAGITILVVQVGSADSNYILNLVTSHPSRYNFFHVDERMSEEEVTGVVEGVKKAVCNDVNECGRNMCINRAECINDINWGYCQCEWGYAGQHCERECPDPGHLIIALDSTKSVQASHYSHMLQFVKHLVEWLPISEETALAGLQSFARESVVRVGLGEYTSKRDLITGVDHVYRGGETYSDHVFRQMGEHFANITDRQSDKHAVGVIVTDGKSADRMGTFAAAVELREKGTHAIAMGVNVLDKYWWRELRGIASGFGDDNTYNISDFETFSETASMRGILADITDAVCNSDQPCRSSPCRNGGRCQDTILGYDCLCPQDYSGLNCERECLGTLDIVFVLDASGSIRERHFEMLKQWIVDVVRSMQVGPEMARIGFVMFSDEPKIAFRMNTYNLAEDIAQAILLQNLPRGQTNIADALQTAREMFNYEDGARYDPAEPTRYPDVIVLISDMWHTMKEEQTLQEAIRTRHHDIRIIVVMPESSQVSPLHEGIASSPVDANVFMFTSFETLPELTLPIVETLCNDVDECASQPCQNGGTCIDGDSTFTCDCQDHNTGMLCERECASRVDVVLLLDVSGSNDAAYDAMLALGRYIIAGLNYAENRATVGVITYSLYSHYIFELNQYHSRDETLNAFHFVRAGSGTYTAFAISSARDMFREVGRSDAKKILVIVSDFRTSVSEDKEDDQAAAAREEGIQILGVPMPNSNLEQLRTITDRWYSGPEAGDRILDVLCS